MEDGLSTIEALAIFIAIIVVVAFALFYLDSKKKTKREKIADAVDKFTDSTTDFLSNTAHKIFDSQEKKEKKNAINNLLFLFQKFQEHAWFYDYGVTKKKIDDAFEYESNKQSFDVLDISKKEWIEYGGMCYYAGILEDYNYSKWNGKKDKVSKGVREIILNPRDNSDLFISRKNNLVEALEHFNISEVEWIEYGDVVLDMHGIRDKIQVWYEGVLKRNDLID